MTAMDQMSQALGLGIGTAVKGAQGSPEPSAGMPGRRTLAAMVAARDDNCPCRSCGLLREELDDAIGLFLKQATAEAVAAPAPEAAAPLTTTLVEAPGAAGNDPPA